MKLFRFMMIFFVWLFSFVNAEDFRYDFITTNDNVNIAKMFNSEKSTINDYKGALNLDYNNATSYIQNVINYFLWIIAFLALVMMVYSFYMIFFSGKGDDAVAKAKKYMFWSIIAIVVSWIAWYIVSLMFYIYEQTK